MTDDVDADANGEMETDADLAADSEATPGEADATDEADATAALAAEVAAYDEELADEVAALEARVETLETEVAEREAEIDDLTSRLKRTQADFQNYKKRAKKRREQMEARATEDLVSRVVGVRDNLVRALEQEGDEGLREGIEGTLKEFDHVLEEEDVTPIEPEAGDEVDPQRHEVMMRVDSEHPEGTVVDVYRPGYEMGDKVVQTAQVTVSDAGEE